jgi:hypothetical protein
MTAIIPKSSITDEIIALSLCFQPRRSMIDEIAELKSTVADLKIWVEKQGEEIKKRDKKILELKIHLEGLPLFAVDFTLLIADHDAKLG